MRVIRILLLSALSCVAQDVELRWNPSASTNVQAYRIYAWTNRPDAQCSISNAVQMVQVGNVTNTTLTDMIAASYTFGATAVITNGAGGESPLSNLAHWEIPPGPEYLIAVQSSTNMIDWTNTPIFFRLKISQ